MIGTLAAGAATADISPQNSQFLCGYPHVERYSAGIHDPLLSTALCLADGREQVMFIANDILLVGKAGTARARARIAAGTGIPAHNIMITATHTHSGPLTLDYVSWEPDPVVPKTDAAYVQLLEDGIVAAALAAHAKVQPAEVGLAVADATGVGSNRRNPQGPADPQVPVLVVRSADNHKPIACMLVYSMHPTVLHEDSKWVSADFPGAARQYLQQNVLGTDCPVLYHTGPAGNQSPRHVTHGSSFAEVRRLGEMLGCAVARVIPRITYSSSVALQSQQRNIDLPRKEFPSVTEAERTLEGARAHFETLRKERAPRAETRTAECDWFGAEETLTLAQADLDGRLDAQYAQCLPAEVQVIRVGAWSFVGWPGEIFVDYALAVKKQFRNAFVLSLANGELGGYIVTEEAALEGGYEASNALFGPEAGKLLVQTTQELLNSTRA